MNDQSAKQPLPEMETEFAVRPRVGSEGFDKGQALKRVKFQHEPIIDAMLRAPRIQNKELAEMFGYTPGWIGRLINSDAFQARYAERKAALTDPGIARRLNARLQGVTIQAVEVISRKLDATDSADFALEALGITTSALAKGKVK